MQASRAGENPFEASKASEFTDGEILKYWVDYGDAQGGLLKILRPRLLKPMLLLGGKGSGKTHLMRYCSAPVQAARQGGDLGKAIAADGYVGIYVLSEGLNTPKFIDAGGDRNVASRVFNMYFELWLSTVLVEVLREYARDSMDGENQIRIAKGIANLFDTDIGNLARIDDVVDYLVRSRKAIDFAVGNSGMTSKLDGVTITFSPGRLIYGIPAVVAAACPEFRETLFVYLIDEVENLTADQQKFLNSLIRYRSGNATIKVGARLYGIKTFDTLGSGEPIKQDAEYERVELDALLREDRRGYGKLATRLVEKRLHAFGAVPVQDGSVADYFETLDNKDYWQAATADLISAPGSARERPYLQQLAADLVGTEKTDAALALEVCTTLSMPEHLYLEKASVFMYRKRWPTHAAVAIQTAQNIACQARALSAGNHDEGQELAGIISHFGSDILAQLYRDFRRRVPYTGFKTLIDLSQGIPRNLLTNLKYIYRRAEFAGERPFLGGRISIRSQTDGVRDGAAWFWEDAQPDSHGLQVRESIEALATLFRTVRFSPSPAECDLCTFSVDGAELSDNAQRVLVIAENWSYLIRWKSGRKNKNSRRLDLKFQLSPMLAPRWEVSEHRRGSIELRADLANAIFDPQRRANLVPLFKQRLQGMMSSSGGSRYKGELLI